MISDFDREPAALGGLFASLHRANKKLVARRTAFLQGEDPGLLDASAREISAKVPPEYLGLIFAAMMEPYVRIALAERNAGNVEGTLDASSLGTLAGYFEAAIASFGEDIYREMAAWVLTRLYGHMVDELRRNEGPSGQCLVFGDFRQVRAGYVRTRSPMEYRAWYDRTLRSVVKIAAALITKQFGLSARPAKALEWLIGQEGAADWLLASEAAVAAHRGDVPHLEELRQQWGMPESYRSERDRKMKYHAGRFRGNPQDARFSLALGQVATTSAQWQVAEKPIGWLVEATWRELRDRQKADELEYVKTAKQGLMTVDDPEEVEGECRPVADAAVEVVPELPDLPLSLLEEGEIRNAAAVRRVYEARRRGVKWEEISAADRSSFRRQQAPVRKLIARETTARSFPDIRYRNDASTGAYREFFYEPDRRLEVWTHVHDTPEKLEALQGVLAKERAKLQREHKD